MLAGPERLRPTTGAVPQTQVAANGLLVIGTGAVASFLLPRLLPVESRLQIFGSPSPRLHALSALASTASDPSAVERQAGWLVCCKTWQNREKVEALATAPAPDRILVLQNGLEPELDWLGLAPVVERGLLTYGVTSVGPGRAAGGEEGEIVLASGSPFVAVLRAAGLRVVEHDDMPAAVWWKLVVNASLNVVAALGGLLNGQVLEHPPSRARARQAALEVAELGRRFGLDLSAQAVAVMERVAAITAGNVCSTLADLRSGRPTEYESINGALLRLAQAQGVRLPMLEELDREFWQAQAGRHRLRAVS